MESGIEAVKKGSAAPGTMSSAESDKYIQNQRKLKYAGVDLDVTQVPEELVDVGGIPVTEGPRIILCPSFAISQEEIISKIDPKGDNKISKRSSLILDGQGIQLRNINLDGALTIRAHPDANVIVDGLTVQNKGWDLIANDPNKEYDETVRIRGYTMSKHETAEYIIDEPGNYTIGQDGELKKLD